MKEKFDVNNYHETRIALLENSVAHISDTLKEIKQDIHSLRVELKTDIAELRVELKSDISGLKKELKSDASYLDVKIDSNVKDLRGEMKDLRGEIKHVSVNSNSQFKWLMGTMISFHFSLLVAIVAKLI